MRKRDSTLDEIAVCADDVASDFFQLPLVVGVTGHRDLFEADRPALTDCVRRLLRQLMNEHGAPLVVVTPLAEGADRLVAKVAISLGAKLVVPLPLRRAEYAADNHSPSSQSEFDALVDGPWTVRQIEMPRVRTSNAAIDAERARALQYALVGAFVARHSQVLIALWDGKTLARIGGTGQIVELRLTGRFALSQELVDVLAAVPAPFGVSTDPLEPLDTGLVYHIPVRRTSAADGAAPPPDLHWMVRVPTDCDVTPEARDRYLEEQRGVALCFGEFNEDARRLVAARPQAARGGTAELGSPPHEEMSATLKSVTAIRRAFAIADALAVTLQRETFLLQRKLLISVGLAVTGFEAYAHIFEPEASASALALLAYLALVGLADLLFIRARQRRLQDRFQDYRAVAEGLRVLYYWRSVGLPHFVSDYYLGRQRDQVRWIREAVRALGVLSDPIVTASSLPLLTSWVEGQRAYFGRRLHAEQGRVRLYRGLSGGLLLVSLLVALLAAVVRTSKIRPWPLTSIAYSMIIIVAVALTRHARSSAHEQRTETGPEAGASLGFRQPLLMGILAGATILAVLIGIRTVSGEVRDVELSWHAWTVMAMSILALAGTLFHAFAEQRAFGQHARQYQRLAATFERGARTLKDYSHARKEPPSTISASEQQLAFDLGCKALSEHADWVLLHRERPIEMPKAEI